MLTSQIKQRLDVPGDDGAWVEIRKLPWRKLAEAAEVQTSAAYVHVKQLGKDGLDAVKGVSADQIAEFKRSPTANYDAGTLLRAAITAWSYSTKPTPDEIDDLDVDTVEWLLPAILTLAKPPRDEVAAKND